MGKYKLEFYFFVFLVLALTILNEVSGTTYFDNTGASYSPTGSQVLVLGALFKFHKNESEICNNYFYVNVSTFSNNTQNFRLYTSDKVPVFLFNSTLIGMTARINYTLENNKYYYIAGDNGGGSRTIALSQDMNTLFPVNNSHFDVRWGAYRNWGATEEWTNGTQFMYEIQGITIECTTPTVVPNVTYNGTGFGDSITAGSLIGTSSAYVKFLDDTKNFSMINYGYDGDNTSKLMARITDVIGKGYNFTVLLIGTNDQFTNNIPHYYYNLDNITKDILNDRQQIILSTIPPCNTSLNGLSCTVTNQSLPISYNNVIRRVSYDNDLCYADIYNDVFNNNYSPEQFYGNDGVHPTESAHKLMNSTYFDAFFNCQSFNCSTSPSDCYNFSATPPSNATPSSNVTSLGNLTETNYLLNQTLYINNKIYGVLSNMGIIIIFIALMVLGLIFNQWLMQLFAGLFGLGLGFTYGKSYLDTSISQDLYVSILFFVLGLAIFLYGIFKAIDSIGSNPSGSETQKSYSRNTYNKRY